MMYNQSTYLKFINLLPPNCKDIVSTLSLAEIKDIILADIGITSMQALQLLMKIENEFSISLSDEYILQGNLLSIDRVIQLIEETE